MQATLSLLNKSKANSSSWIKKYCHFSLGYGYGAGYGGYAAPYAGYAAPQGYNAYAAPQYNAPVAGYNAYNGAYY